MNTCKTCDFFLDPATASVVCDMGFGWCRRHAPVTTQYGLSTLPTVRPDDGCGDHQPRTEPERWAIVEIMGHQRLAGRLSVDYSTGHALTRIDVPEVQVEISRWPLAGSKREVAQVTIPDHTAPLLGKGAIFAIQEVERAVAMQEAVEIAHKPMGWEGPTTDSLTWTAAEEKWDGGDQDNDYDDLDNDCDDDLEGGGR